MTDAMLSTRSTVAQRQVGRYLRDARNQSRLTAEAAASALEWGRTKLWKIETGQARLRTHEVEAMCRVYGATAELTEVLTGLSRQTRAEGWWHDQGDAIPTGFDLYVGLEGAASELNWYESERVPGLLQTADYARAVIAPGPDGTDPADVERRVQLRMARQTLLTRVTAAPRLEIVLNEAVLRRPIGGRRVMAEQLARLLEISELPSVALHVLPFSFGLHDGLDTGSFVLMRFPPAADGREREPPVVYVEGFTGGLYLDKPHEIEKYATAFAAMLRRIDDGDTARSKGFLHEAARELYG